MSSPTSTSTSTSTPDTPRRKPRPSPIHVPSSPNTRLGGREPPATSTGIVWRRKPSFVVPSFTPRSAGLEGDQVRCSSAVGDDGVIGEDRSSNTTTTTNTTPHRRSSSTKDWLPAPKSAAANFAQTRGIQSVTVRTIVSPRSPPLSGAQARSTLSASSLSSGDRGLGSPVMITNPFSIEDKERMSKSAVGLNTGLRSSRTVEVDFLRNEMERAIKANRVDLRQNEGGGMDGEIVRNDSRSLLVLINRTADMLVKDKRSIGSLVVLCKFYHTPGLTCTSRPCRFIHEFSPSVTTPSSATFPHTSDRDGDPNDALVSTSNAKPMEIVEIYPMSGGGKGAGSRYSKAKYRTVDCRDWEDKGECGYGEFCSFVHREKDGREVMGERDGEVTEEEVARVEVDDKLEMNKEKQPERPLSTRPKSFNGGPIVVPDLRWTRDDGLTVSNPATATKPDFRHVANKLVETISSATPGSATLDVMSPQTKVSTPATAVQYASVPPRSAWVVGPPRMLGVETAQQGVSPDLPISAYTFSTDSPGTPFHGVEGEAEGDSDVPEEAIEHGGQDDQVSVQIVTGVEPMNRAGYSPFENPHLVLPSYLETIHDSGAYPWPIERLYPQAMQATWDAILKNPKEQKDVDVEETTRRLVVMKLARMVKGGDLPPQEVQSKMNYRTKPCKFYANGDCPRGDACSYLHDPSNKGIPAPKPLNDKVVKKLPCKFFNTSEGCKAGDECPFLHVRVVPFGAPLMLRPRPWRTRPCRHFQTGTCVAGDQCHFAHYLEEKPVKEQKKCAFFSTSAGCKLGGGCKFAHVPEVVVE